MVILVSLIFLELGVRVILAFQVRPQIILYGTQYCCGPNVKSIVSGKPKPEELEAGIALGGVKFHKNERLGYSKYFPKQNRRDNDTDYVSFEVTINNHGFRGEDYSNKRTPGVLRVVTLGASSTFGYRNRDHQTYPYQLQSVLNEKLQTDSCEDVVAFEVINLGIPHTTSKQNVALYLAEGKSLKPDVVTFYEGVNDTNIGMDSLRWELLPYYRRVIRYYKDYFVTCALLDSIVLNRIEHYTQDTLNRLVEGKSEAFVNNIDQIRKDVENEGGIFFVATQQAKSLMIPRDAIRGVSYSEESAAVKQKLKETGKVNVHELWFLVHNDLMSKLRQKTQEDGQSLIDIIAAMDDRRDYLVSWVHLDPDGNKLVAEEFAEAIFEATCL